MIVKTSRLIFRLWRSSGSDLWQPNSMSDNGSSRWNLAQTIFCTTKCSVLLLAKTTSCACRDSPYLTLLAWCFLKTKYCNVAFLQKETWINLLNVSLSFLLWLLKYLLSSKVISNYLCFSWEHYTKVMKKLSSVKWLNHFPRCPLIV